MFSLYVFCSYLRFLQCTGLQYTCRSTSSRAHIRLQVIRLINLWLLVKFCLRDTAGSPERARWLHLARSGSQSQLAIWFILPAHGASHKIKLDIALDMLARAWFVCVDLAFPDMAVSDNWSEALICSFLVYKTLRGCLPYIDINLLAFYKNAVLWLATLLIIYSVIDSAR